MQHFASFVDLTKQKQEQARSTMMINELNHRVKNTLATVQSIVWQALRGDSDPKISASTIVQPPASADPPKEANQAVVAAAGAAWPTLPTMDSTLVTPATIVEETQPATDHANIVQISNGSVLTGNWSMFSYLFLILSGVLAVLAAWWLLPRMRVRAKSEVAG